MYIPVLHQEQRDAVIMFLSSSTCLTCTYLCCTRIRETPSSGLYHPSPVQHVQTCAASGTERHCHQICTIFHLFNMYIPVLHQEQRHCHHVCIVLHLFNMYIPVLHQEQRRCHHVCTVLHLFNMYIPVLHQEQRCYHHVCTVLYLFNMYIAVLHQEQSDAVIKFLPSSTSLTCTYLCCNRIRETPSSGLYHPSPV